MVCSGSRILAALNPVYPSFLCQSQQEVLVVVEQPLFYPDIDSKGTKTSFEWTSVVPDNLVSSSCWCFISSTSGATAATTERSYDRRKLKRAPHSQEKSVYFPRIPSSDHRKSSFHSSVQQIAIRPTNRRIFQLFHHDKHRSKRTIGKFVSRLSPQS